MDFSLLLAQQTIPQQEGVLGIIDKVARTQLSVVVMFMAVCTVIRLAAHFILLKPVPVYLRGGGHRLGTIINEITDAIIYAGIFVFLVIRPFVIQTFVIPSGSMVKTLLVHDYIVANKMIYRYSEPQHGDIIVFKPPQAAVGDGDRDATDFIKRLIGMPGDTIEVKNNILYRNGQKVEEPYKFFSRSLDSKGATFEELTPEGIDAVMWPDFKLVEYNGKPFPVNVSGMMVNDKGMFAPQYQATSLDEAAKLRSLPPMKIPPGYYFMMGDNRFGSLDSRFWGLIQRDDIIGRAECIWFPFNRWRFVR